MQNTDVCVTLHNKFNIADFKGRGVLKVNSPVLFCVQIVIVGQTLLQNIVPCGWVNFTKSNFTLYLTNKIVMYYNLLSKIFFGTSESDFNSGCLAAQFYLNKVKD